MAINKNDYLDGDGNYDLKKSLVDEIIDGIDALIDGVDGSSKHYSLDYAGDRAGLINKLIAIFNASENGVHGYFGAWQGNYYLGGNIYKIATNIGIITMITATSDASSKIYNAGVGWSEASL